MVSHSCLTPSPQVWGWQLVAHIPTIVLDALRCRWTSVLRRPRRASAPQGRLRVHELDFSQRPAWITARCRNYRKILFKDGP
jgi:hypothetical protein